MDIYVDKEKIETQFIEATTIIDILKELEENLLKDRKIISDIKINDIEFQLVENINTIEVKKIEIFTVTEERLFIESFREMETYIENFVNGVDRIVDLLAKDSQHEAMNMVVDAVEGLEWIYNVLYKFKINYNNIFEKINLQELFEDFQYNLEELLECLEKKDDIMLSDILEYETVEVLRDLQALIPEIHNSLEEEDKNKILNS
ncbi:MAG: hypothetical protein GX287_03180 [Fusobacteria bacterium]|nr:hypothetical protein [Fusobacteriota bacterium]